MSNIKKLSRAQRELVINTLIAPDTGIGMTGGTMEIRGPILLEDFENAIDQLIEYHEASRIRFHIIESEIFQYADKKDLLLRLNFEDFSGETNPEILVQNRIQELFSQPLRPDLSSSLFRNYLFKLGPEHHIYFTYAHHALIDGWGYSIWTSNLIRLLDRKTTFPTYSFLDYIEENIDWFENPSAKRSLDYWRNKLPTKPQALFTPIKDKTLEAQNIRMRISATRYEKWQAIANENQISTAALMSAALLYEVADYNQVAIPVIGTPILNRPSPASKLIVGLFTHIIPLQAKITPGESLINFAKRITQIQRLDYRHSRISIGDLSPYWGQDIIDEEAIQVTFSFERHDYNQSLTNCELVIDALSPKTQVRPLQIYAREYQQGRDFLIDAYFNTSYFTEQSAQTLLKRWCACIDQKDPSEFYPLPKSLPYQMEWSSLTSSNLWQSFATKAKENPESIAVEDEFGRKITYGELLIQAQKLSNSLKIFNVACGDSIGIACDRKAELIIGILGILGSGCSYVPLDPRYPQDRISYLLDDSNTSIVLADSMAAGVFKNNTSIKLLEIEKIIESECTGEFIEPIISPLQTAYIIYTSGSTGNPKGCIVTHQNVIELIRSAGGLHGYSSKDIWTLFHSFAFDFSVWEIWGALLFGGKLLVVSYETSRDPSSFLSLLSKNEVTILNQTPTAFRSLLHSISEAHLEGQATKLFLRKIIFGGEALDPSILKPWVELYGQETTFINMYGITETTVHVTNKEINLLNLDKTSVIGNALPNWSVYALNSSFNQVGQNQVGELFVGGAGVTQGYHGRPSLTAERFLPDPFANNGTRMYRSGDLAKINELGELEYLGRLDQQVKIRGFRIEIGEIENALKLHPEILDAIVLAEAIENYQEKRLIAWFIQKNPTKNLQAEEIRGFLQASLPEHMIPSRFIQIDFIPQTVNGKLDKSALPISSSQNITIQKELPLLGIETILGNIWQKVLQVDQVYREDNFFSIGGDSISALKVISMLHKEHLFLRLSDIYKFNTLKFIASHCKINSQNSNPFNSNQIQIWDTPKEVEDAYPMAALQAGMLFHSKFERESSIFLDVFNFRVIYPWHEINFKESLKQLTKDFAALRTCFDWENYSEPLQLVHKESDVPLCVYDLSSLDGEKQKQQIEEYIELEKKREFDISTPPLIRFSICILSENMFSIIASFHHSIVDGWSFATLMSRLLRYFVDNTIIGTLDKPTELQKHHVYIERQGRLDTALKEFWNKYLSNLSDQHKFNLKGKSKQPIRITFEIKQEIFENVINIAESLSVPIKTVFLGVHFLSLLRFTKQNELCTGYVVNCRPELSGADTAVGLFLNTIPIRYSLPPPGNIRQWIKNLFDEETEVLAHRHLPLVDIIKQCSSSQPFITGFNYVHFHVYDDLIKNSLLKIDNVEVFEHTDFPFLAQFSVDPRNHKLELSLIFADDNLSSKEINELGLIYLESLEMINIQCAQEIKFSSDLTSAKKYKLKLNESDIPNKSKNNTELIFTNSSTTKKINYESWSDFELEILEIWKSVLPFAEISKESSFFAIGGDSITATRLVALLRKKFSIELTLKEFFESPNINSIALRLITSSEKSKSSPPIIPKARRNKTSSQ